MSGIDGKRRVQARLDELTAKGAVPGIQYAAVNADGELLELCSGVVDVASGAPVTHETTFMASSVTKTLTAAAVLQLVERDQLRLDDRLSDHYPAHPYGDALKIRHLVNQTSGVANPLPLKWLHLVQDHDGFDEQRALEMTLKRYSKLQFAPGSRYAYSNLSYWLLGRVIERASGSRYADYMRDRLFEPLGISRRELGVEIPAPELHARGHLKRLSLLGLLMPLLMRRELFDRSARGRWRVKPVYMNGPAYGGLIGTARAFAAFLRDQLQPEPVVFGAETKALFFSEQSDNQGRPIETTLGWHRGALDSVPYYSKPGGGPGFQSNLRLYPDKGIGTCWLANETGASEGPIHALSDSLDRHLW